MSVELSLKAKRLCKLTEAADEIAVRIKYFYSEIGKLTQEKFVLDSAISMTLKEISDEQRRHYQLDLALPR